MVTTVIIGHDGHHGLDGHGGLDGHDGLDGLDGHDGHDDMMVLMVLMGMMDMMDRHDRHDRYDEHDELDEHDERKVTLLCQRTAVRTSFFVPRRCVLRLHGCPPARREGEPHTTSSVHFGLFQKVLS